MRKVSPEKDKEAKYYIPHQPVIREDSTTTKLRVVFDASSKTSTGISFNDTMYTGPRLQQDLTDILLRWRKYRVVFSADIEKMYRQIKIDEEDQQFHRILWRFKETQPIQEYSLTTITYGTAAASYLAIKTIQQLADENIEEFPKASQTILKDFYVDDLLSGADTTKEAMEIQEQVTLLLKSGGFKLRKWCSNTSACLQNLPEESRDQSALEITEDGIKKSLGVLWAPFDDTFRFKVHTIQHPKITKRTILSEVAKLFDPLGWLAPIIVKAKLLIQQLWMQELQWDQTVPEDIKNQWNVFTTHLKDVEEIKIPRWLNFTNNKKTSIELHGFCDASEKAYGAVIYARTSNISTEAKTVLLVAKSKIAPARSKTTLPRLELCATVLLAKLIKRTITALEIKNIPIYAWTDSMVVLGWLKGDPSRWKTFVANRVSEVNKIIPATVWHHVSSEDNPADFISRGLHPSKIKNNFLWWNGPLWLAKQSQWPHQQEAPRPTEEIKICCQVITQIEENTIMQRFSSLIKLVRVLSYCKRFINNAKGYPKQVRPLSVQEMDSTLLQLVKITQCIYFKAEINDLKNRQQVNKTSKLLNLNPFLDSFDNIRVGGRLEHSSMTYQQKHPLILPSSSHLSLLIIRDAHHTTLHGGNQTTLAYIRRKYWIVNGKKAVRSTLSKCIVCLRYRARTSRQLMGNLPAPRVTSLPPFLHSGVDYAGPIQIRAFHGRGHKSYKGYIAVFICLSTKAIHLEVVSSMTTDAFMAAFRRFVSRRGRCAHVYSDNGTNFVGASKLLEKEAYNITSHSEVQDPVMSGGTQWHFIPPAAPHFGGLWEAGVKSMKYHLKRVVGNSTLTYEELTTLLHQIEACLNSRPLYPLDDSSNEIEVLTPGHFLIGREIVSPPNPVTTTINSNLNSRWKTIQKMKKDFWQSWTSEYLHRLQQRYKWKTPQENLQEGGIVLLKEDNINPSKWPLARITEVHPGSDNKIRVVTIKKSDGNSFKRSITNIIPLPKNSEKSTPQQKPAPQQIQSNSIKTRYHPSKRSSFNILVLWVGLLLTTQPNSIQAGYSIQSPEPGLYIEHMGQAKIERGSFRTDIKLEKTKIEADVTAASEVINQFDKLCQETRSMSDETQCTTLVHHIKEQENELQWIKSGLTNIQSKRQRRGLLGNFLTSIFGVNDEVYEDINSLKNNQQKLIETADHQTKLMLSALAIFNQTEKRISYRLEHFRKKLNQGIDAINQMKKWFKTIDENKINIHLLSIYQVATNYVTELISYYVKLLNIQLGRGNLYDLLSAVQINEMVTAANSKLPTNLRILSSPIVKMAMKQDKKHFHVFGYFLIVEISEYTIIRATPTPLKITNGSYWALDISTDLLAIDYNSQLYFTLTDEEFKESVRLPQHTYVCSPSVVKNIETNPNCVIDEIYQRTDHNKCKTQKNFLDRILWKQLNMDNTWLFIVNHPTKVAVICNGQREDVTLNNTGIIKITQDCSIHTKQNILSTQRKSSMHVMGSYSKAIKVLINTTVNHQQPNNIPREPVLKPLDNINTVRMEEHDIQDTFHHTTWKSIKHHSLLTSSLTTISLLGGAALLWVIYIYCSKRRRRNLSASPLSSDSPATPQPEMIELEPLNLQQDHPSRAHRVQL